MSSNIPQRWKPREQRRPVPFDRFSTGGANKTRLEPVWKRRCRQRNDYEEDSEYVQQSRSSRRREVPSYIRPSNSRRRTNDHPGLFQKAVYSKTNFMTKKVESNLRRLLHDSNEDEEFEEEEDRRQKRGRVEEEEREDEVMEEERVYRDRYNRRRRSATEGTPRRRRREYGQDEEREDVRRQDESNGSDEPRQRRRLRISTDEEMGSSETVPAAPQPMPKVPPVQPITVAAPTTHRVTDHNNSVLSYMSPTQRNQLKRPPATSTPHSQKTSPIVVASTSQPQPTVPAVYQPDNPLDMEAPEQWVEENEANREEGVRMISRMEGLIPVLHLADTMGNSYMNVAVKLIADSLSERMKFNVTAGSPKSSRSSKKSAIMGSLLDQTTMWQFDPEAEEEEEQEPDNLNDPQSDDRYVEELMKQVAVDDDRIEEETVAERTVLVPSPQTIRTPGSRPNDVTLTQIMEEIDREDYTAIDSQILREEPCTSTPQQPTIDRFGAETGWDGAAEDDYDPFSGSPVESEHEASLGRDFEFTQQDPRSSFTEGDLFAPSANSSPNLSLGEKSFADKLFESPPPAEPSFFDKGESYAHSTNNNTKQDFFETGSEPASSMSTISKRSRVRDKSQLRVTFEDISKDSPPKNKRRRSQVDDFLQKLTRKETTFKMPIASYDKKDSHNDSSFLHPNNLSPPVRRRTSQKKKSASLFSSPNFFKS